MAENGARAAAVRGHRRPRTAGPGAAIEVRAGLDLSVPADRVRAVLLDIESWGRTFPASLRGARVVAAGAGTVDVVVDHRTEGAVRNRLTLEADGGVRVEEWKRHYDAVFLHEFLPLGNGSASRCRVTCRLRLKGPYRVLRPLRRAIERHARRQIEELILHPLRAAAERSGAPEP